MFNFFLDTKSGSGLISLLDYNLSVNIIPTNVPLYFKKNDNSWDLMGQSLVATNTEPNISNVFDKITDIYYETLFEHTQDLNYIDITKYLESLVTKYFYIGYYQPIYMNDYVNYYNGNIPDFNNENFYKDYLSKITIKFNGCDNYKKNLRFKYIIRYDNKSILETTEQSLRGTYFISLTMTSLRKKPMIERPIDEKIPTFAIKLYTKNNVFKQFYAFCAKLKLNPKKQFKIYLNPLIKKDFHDVFFEVIDNVNKSFEKLNYLPKQFKLITKNMKEFPKDYSPVNLKYPSISLIDSDDFLGISSLIEDPRSGEIIWFNAQISSPQLLFGGFESNYNLTNINANLFTNYNLTNINDNLFTNHSLKFLMNKNHELMKTCKCCSKIEFIEPLIKLLYANKLPKDKLIKIIKKY